MVSEHIARLAELQQPNGCFPSRARGRRRDIPDENGFTAAIVLRTLRHVPATGSLFEVKQRALGYIESCRSRTVEGAFGFWPEAARPKWASRLPADLDDTALMSLELLRAGRLAPAQALAATDVLVQHRARAEGARPPWIRTGAFLTWVTPPGATNVVDCCVNANVLALLARIEARDVPGYREAIQTISLGLDWAGDDRARLRSLSPFYPATRDLYDAVTHAVESGVTELAECGEALRCRIGATSTDEDPGCCSSAYGAMVWRCPGIDAARSLVSRL